MVFFFYVAVKSGPPEESGGFFAFQCGSQQTTERREQ
jgi:hypothetical protein